MAAVAKRLVLITGANSGIGFELAAQLLAKGTYHVFLGARSAEKGNAALQQLRSRNLPNSVEMLLLDVTKDESIEEAAAKVRKQFGKLDILVNNAAIAPMEGGTLRERMRTAFDTNATGPLIVTKAFAPLLKESKDSPRIVNITSGAGSITSRLNKNSPLYKLQGHQYRASKTALNMITACQYVEYEPDGITVLLYDPGYTVSNLGPHNKAEFGARAPVDSVMPLIDIIEGKRDDEAPKILHNTVLAERKIALSHVLLTHWHGDHAGGVPDLLRLYPHLNGSIYKHTPSKTQQPIVDEQVFEVEGATVKVLHSPGHSHDHMCFIIEEDNAICTGDNVLDHGTAAVEMLSLCMDSLRLMQKQECKIGYPAHVMVIEDLPIKISGELASKTRREKQVLQALNKIKNNAGSGKADVTVKQLVTIMYGEGMADEVRQMVIEPFMEEV